MKNLFRRFLNLFLSPTYEVTYCLTSGQTIKINGFIYFEALSNEDQSGFSKIDWKRKSNYDGFHIPLDNISGLTWRHSGWTFIRTSQLT